MLTGAGSWLAWLVDAATGAGAAAGAGAVEAGWMFFKEASNCWTFCACSSLLASESPWGGPLCGGP